MTRAMSGMASDTSLFMYEVSRSCHPAKGSAPGVWADFGRMRAIPAFNRVASDDATG
ncbi:hypothetical protein WKW50_24350 [Ochrobactrum sp. GPK 3]|uniref:hypothetical protein n=1 Tax=Brucella sp. 22210 TaxID=3453892 RepID=UPI0031384D1A